jgi:hypothetical protein
MGKRQVEEDRATELRDGLVEPTALEKAKEQAWVPVGLKEALAKQTPLSAPAVKDPVSTARDFALAAAELMGAPSMLAQSRMQAIRFLNAAIALIGT